MVGESDHLEMARVTEEEEVDDLHAVVRGMVDTGEGNLDLAQLIEIYKEGVTRPSTLLACAKNGRGPIGYVYIVLRKGPEGLVGVVEQIYSEEPNIGRGLYLLAEMWAMSEGATSIRSVVSTENAEAVARLFGASIKGVVVGKEL